MTLANRVARISFVRVLGSVWRYISTGNVIKQLVNAFSCALLHCIELSCIWEISRALRRLELLLLSPQASLTLFFRALQTSRVHHLSNRGFFHVYIASSKHEGGWKNLRQLCKPETQSKFASSENSPSFPSVSSSL